MAGANDNDRYVQQRSDGRWEVVKEDHHRASAVTDTQRQAIDRARPIIKNAGGGELVIKNTEGEIRAKDTIAPGSDPRSPKG